MSITALERPDVRVTAAAREAMPGEAGGLATSAGKALAVLDAFRGSGVLLGVTQIAERAHVPKSTAHRLLAVLVERGYIARIGVRYRLGRATFELGNMVAECRPRSLRALAMPYMTDLYATLHATVHLAVLDGSDVLYVDKIYGHHGVDVPSRVGGRVPALCTALGKAMLAHSSKEVIAHALNLPVPRLTQRTVITPSLLCSALAQARETGIAYDREGSSLGAQCLAAPILCPTTGEVLGALSVSFPVTNKLPTQAAVQLKRAAAAVSAAC
jgi:DNA-binding IclR family transcriptional regulator